MRTHITRGSPTPAPAASPVSRACDAPASVAKVTARWPTVQVVAVAQGAVSSRTGVAAASPAVLSLSASRAVAEAATSQSVESSVSTHWYR